MSAIEVVEARCSVCDVHLSGFMGAPIDPPWVCLGCCLGSTPESRTPEGRAKVAAFHARGDAA